VKEPQVPFVVKILLLPSSLPLIQVREVSGKILPSSLLLFPLYKFARFVVKFFLKKPYSNSTPNTTVLEYTTPLMSQRIFVPVAGAAIVAVEFLPTHIQSSQYSP